MHISTHTDIPKETQTYTHTHKNTCTDTDAHSYMAQKHMCRTTLRFIHTLAFLASGFRLGTFPICTQSSLSPLSHYSQGTGRAGKRPVSPPPPTSQIYILGQDTGGQRLGGGVGAAPPQVSRSPPVTCILESTCHPHTLEEKTQP